MRTETTQERTPEWVRQFSIFTVNRLGRLHDVFGALGTEEVHVLALSVVDTTDSAIIRLVVDDPQKARAVLGRRGFGFTEGDLLGGEDDYTTELHGLMTALLEAEPNINYLYSFIPHPRGKSLLALSMEDNEIAEQVLKGHQFRVLRQGDISR
jgi:hypothetical protein